MLDKLTNLQRFMNEYEYCLHNKKDFAKDYDKEIYYKYRYSLKQDDEHLQALELIVNKGVDVGTFKEEIGWDRFNYEYYLKYYRQLSLEELTKEEFGFIVKVVKEIYVNE